MPQKNCWMRAFLWASIVTSALLSASYIAATAQQTKHRVAVTEVERDALEKVKTYTWTVSHPSFDKIADKQIIAAVDRELMARGLTKLATGRGDAEVTYASLSRTDVDLKSEPSATGQVLFNAKVHSPIDTAPAKLEAAINAATAAIFRKYPVHPVAKD